MDFTSFALGSLSSAFLLAVLAFVSKTWIEKRIEFSIQHEYDKKLALLESEREVRLRAELVADLMAEWIRDKDKLDYFRLNQLSFQAFLWLPPALARDLSATLSHKSKEDDLRSILQKVRKHLLGPTDDLESQKVVVFTKRDAEPGV